MSVIAPILRPILQPILRSVFDVGVGGGVVPVPPNLVTNGTFDTDTSGWASGGASTLSWDATEQAAVSAITGGGGGIMQTVAVEPFTEYLLKFEAWTGTYAGTKVSTLASNGLPALTFTISGARQTFEVPFTALDAPVVLRFSRGDSFTGTMLFDNIEIRAVVSPGAGVLSQIQSLLSASAAG